MRIRTQLSLTLALIAVAGITVTGMSLFQDRELMRLARGQEAVDALSRAAQEIALLSNELMLDPSDRVRMQWRAVNRSLGERLRGDQCCEGPLWQSSVDELRREHQALLDSYERLATLDPVAPESPASRLLRPRLASSLLSRSRNIQSLLRELSESKRVIRIERIEDVALLAALVDGLAFLVAGLLLWLLGRRLLEGMDSLSRGFRRVAAGDLSHRVNRGQRDEFGDLALGFDQMTAQVAEQTERLRRSEAALAEANRELEQKVAARTVELDNAVRQLYEAGEEVAHSQRLATMGKLVASITHELNNPLMGALNYVQFVRAQLADVALGGWLDKAESEIVRATDVVQNLLAFGRRGEEKRQPVDLTPLVDEVLALAAPALARAGAEAFNRVPPGLDAVSGQPKLLRQILLNLVLNAADAVTGFERREILIGAGAKGDHIHVFIEDTGPGVPASIRERIFEPFFTTKGERGGTGLGLALARRLAEGGGATLDYVQRARGGRFELVLPVPDDADDALSAKSEPKTAATLGVAATDGRRRYPA